LTQSKYWKNKKGHIYGLHKVDAKNDSTISEAKRNFLKVSLPIAIHMLTNIIGNTI
jgi:hypothetical protein